MPVDGRALVDPDDVRRALRPDTKLISIILANNETGVLQPVNEIGKIAAEADVYFHTDAVQAAGKVPLDVKEIGCDLLTLTATRCMGRMAQARCMCARERCCSRCSMADAMSARAAPARRTCRESSGWARRRKSRARDSRTAASSGWRRCAIAWSRRIVETIEQVSVNSGDAPRVPNTTNIFFDCIEGEAMVIALDLKGLSVSTGAACSSGAIEPSHVLTAMGLSPDRARASIRFSLGKQNTADDVDFALQLMPEVVTRLRELSPV